MGTCGFRSSCAYYNDLKDRKPLALMTVTEEFCDNNYSRCARFMIYEARGPMNNIPTNLFPEDVDEAWIIVGNKDSFSFPPTD